MMNRRGDLSDTSEEMSKTSEHGVMEGCLISFCFYFRIVLYYEYCTSWIIKDLKPIRVG